jgi:acyl dehydratase
MAAVGRLQAGKSLPVYRVTAANSAATSENKIHDDTVARQYGFAGGLVPGVTVYAYMMRPAVEVLGPGWLERGSATVRLLKPFYEGEVVSVECTVTEAGDAIALDVSARNAAGELCAAGTATLPAVAVELPDAARFPRAPRPAERPPVSEEVLRNVSVLGAIDEVYTAEAAARFVAEISDDMALWRGEGSPAHPGFLIRYANAILATNVLLNPWIHVSSDVTNYRSVRTGAQLSARGRVTDLFERKGHKFVRLDMLLVDGDEQHVMLVDHTAIYDPRKVG